MHLVKYHPGHLPEQLAAPVDHAAQDLCCHHDAVRIGVDGDVTRHQADIHKLLSQLPAKNSNNKTGTAAVEGCRKVSVGGRMMQGHADRWQRQWTVVAVACGLRVHAAAGYL